MTGKKERISKLPITIFSIHGNHEQCPDTIPSYDILEWHSGQVYVEEEYPNLLFAMDAVMYVLRDKDPELRKLWAEVCGKDE